MTKLIVTGHGRFASGLLSSLELISGKQDRVKAIDFLEGMSADELEKKILQEIPSADSSELIFIFTDIPGGTPFNQSVLLSTEMDFVEVIAGTNLPILMEAIFNLREEKDVFLEKILGAGRQGIVVYQPQSKSKKTESKGKGI